MLPYSYIEGSRMGVLPRAPNGGLYTGEAARGPWGNVPVSPEVHTLALNLASANPPPGGAAQGPFGVRPGNNEPQLVFYEPLNASTYPGLYCMRTEASKQ